MSIQGRTELDYRKVNMDSSSSLKDFSLDRRKYYKKYYLNEPVEEKENVAINTGRIVETLLLEPELFDNRFYLSSCVSSPTGLMMEFVEALYQITRAATNEDDEITRSFEEMSREAYAISGFKIKYEAVINKFIGSDAEIYYNEIRQVRSNNLTVVTTQDVTNAERIVEELKNNFVTSKIINLVDSKQWGVLNQYQIEGYSVDGHLFKSMIDKVVVNHYDKSLQAFDLKCTWSVENFLNDYFLYRRSYIQAYLYYKALVSISEDIKSEYYGYTVLPTAFIVCDSINYYNPLIYTLTEDDLNDAYMGFTHNGKDYPGVKVLIEDLKWAIDNNIWVISRINYFNNGMVNIRE